MYKYEYLLKYKNETYKCTHPVIGFEEEGVKFGKESENKGVIKSYAGEFTLLGNDAQFIKSIYINYGFNEKIRLDVYKNDFLKGRELEYSAFIDLSTVSLTNDKVSFSLKQGGFITFIDNILKKEFTLSNNSGFKSMIYNGNKYDFDIDIVSNQGLSTTFKDEEIKHILPVVIKENNNNYEDIRIFRSASQNELTDGVKITNDDCFIIINEQKYIENIKFNFNIERFEYKNLTESFINFVRETTVANCRFKYTLNAYSNVKDEWDIDDSSLIMSKEFNAYLKYRVSFEQITNPIDDTHDWKIMGECINMNYNYIFSQYITTILNDSNYDNIKFILTVTPIDIGFFKNNTLILEVYDDSGNQQFDIQSKIDIKCTFKNFQLVPYKLLNCWSVESIYKYILFSNKTEYNVNYDLTNISNIPYYLTSSSEICGDTKLVTTLEDLLQFVYLTTGYRQIIDELNGSYNVYFEKYEQSFKEIEIAKIDNIQEITIDCEASKIFTDVEIGWDNKDSGIFKSLEYNTVNKFRTQYNNIESNVLSLNCKYSASVTDVETVIYNAGYNDKTNNASDIFVIEGYFSDGYVRNKQHIGSGSIKLCGNVSLTPKRLLEVHKYELSDFLYHLNVLKFNTSNGKADITLDGVTENTDVTFNNQIMQPFILSFDGVINQSIIKIDARKYGYFTFKYEGNYIRGYIAEGSDSVSVAANGNVSKLRLIVKNNVNL